MCVNYTVGLYGTLDQPDKTDATAKMATLAALNPALEDNCPIERAGVIE